MPRVGEPTDVALSTLDQTNPVTSGPVGRLTRMENAVVRQFNPGAAGLAVKVEKREGFASRTNVFRDPTKGSILSADLSNASVFTTGNNALIGVANNRPNVLTNDWEHHAFVLPTQALRARTVYTANSQVETPDHATMLGNTAHVWCEFSVDVASGSPVTGPISGTRLLIEDENGVVVFGPVTVNQDTRVHIVSDGTWFWWFSSTGTTVHVRVYDSVGGLLTSSTTTGLDSADADWDLCFQPGNGVLFATHHNASNGVTVVRYRVVSVSIATDVHVISTIDNSFNRVAWMVNNTGDTNAYLVTSSSDGFGHQLLRGYQIDNTGSLVVTHTFDVWLTDIAGRIAGITGYVAEDGTKDLYVSYTLLDVTNIGELDGALNNTIHSLRARFNNTQQTELKVRVSLSLTSKAFKLGPEYFAVAYYHGPSLMLDKTGSPDLTSRGWQPCWFLVPLQSAQPTSGRFEYGLAIQTPVVPPVVTGSYVLSVRLNMLAGTFVAADGSVRVPLPYRAENIFARIQTVGGDIPVFGVSQQNTVGVKSFRLGPDSGHAVEYSGQVVIPGPVSTSYQGTFAEQGLLLAPERPTYTTVGTGIAGHYQWIAVAELTDDNGDRSFSVPSPALENTNSDAGGSHTYALTGVMQHVASRNFIIAIYRNTQADQKTHRKLISDLTPIFNADGTATWTFNDNIADSQVALGEPLYADVGPLPHHPAPPHHASAVWIDRLFVAAYDGSIWFSAEKNEGEGVWFHPGFRIVMPTSDPIVALAAMDSFLLILCKNSLWTFPKSTLPDATGSNGSIGTPDRLPFANGCTGPTAVVREGCIYASSAGSVWLITRDLSNVWIGEQAKDDLTGTILDIVSDGNHQVHVLCGTHLSVYDSTVRAWYLWTLPGPPVLLANFAGRVAFVDSGGLAWAQVAGSYIDFITHASTTIAIETTVEVAPIHLGSVRGLKRTWGIQIIGEAKSRHILHIDVSFDDLPGSIITGFTITPQVGAIQEELALKLEHELSSSIGFLFSDTYDAGAGIPPGRGFTIEMISFWLAIEKGLKRLPAAQKTAPSS